MIAFNYDANANLISITQAGRTDPWVTFGWGIVAMAPALSGVVGTRNGEVIPVLASVSFPDGSYDNFLYNPSGQVNQITHYVFDEHNANHERSRTIFNYGAADDLTRLANIHLAAENWTGINGVPAEVVTEFGIEGTAHTVKVVGDPNGTVYKESYGTGWQRGLSVSAQVFAGGALQKTTTMSWAKDANTSNNFPTNPRVIETNVIDSANNHSRTTIGYDTFTLPTSGVSCSLPNEVYEYEANATTVARRTHTGYNKDLGYLNARVIGLPQAKILYEGTSTVVSKTTYVYDAGDEFLQGLPATLIQHDGNYSTDYVVGRGNLVKVLRWDVSDASNTLHTESKAGYDIAGSIRFTRDALDHQTTINYTDAFSVNGIDLDAPRSFATFAYPTTITDPDGYSSSLRYRYDFGAKSRVQGPPPDNQPNGIIQTLTYDDAGRVKRATTLNTGSYTHYEYGPNYAQAFASVNTVSVDPYSSDSYSIQVFDGLGRVFAAASNHPGSAGGYSAVYSIYDVMGRAIKQSSPTETTGGWAPTGDDAVGWIFTQQTYDWKGRPLLTVNPSITANPNDVTTKEASYSACGCAGSEIVTLEDEVGRIQKVYSDVLGRQWKTEIMNGASVYSTTVSVYDGRDQIIRVKQYAGTAPAEASSTNAEASCLAPSCQESRMEYDGYGRLKIKHLPEQQIDVNNSSSTDHTTWDYYADDTILKTTDARGASASYTYNNRHLVSHIGYAPPASGGLDTPDVSFEYDAAGNRRLMTDGLGSKSYTYNQLSQLMSETRTFTNVGTFTLGYDYNLAGELKKFTDSTNMTINYGYDSAGRLGYDPTTGINGVTGSDNLYAGVTNYASNFQYRAWGGLKAMTDGKGYSSSMTYNSKLQPKHFEIAGGAVSQNYDYYDDGHLSFVHNTTDSNFDRSYSYDWVGRLNTAKSGGQARSDFGGTPYYESFGYDAFSNLTARQNDSWNGQTTASDSSSYTDNRHDGWGYDADGRNISVGSRSNAFDAAGRQAQMTTQQILANGNHITVSQTSGHDGDGASVFETGSGGTTYHLRSTPLGGQIIEELNISGQKMVGYVSLPGGQLLATQTTNPDQIVVWKHNTPAGTGEYTVSTDNSVVGRVEFDPIGADISLTQPPDPPLPQGEGDINARHFGGLMDQRTADFFNLDSGFTVDGFPISSSEATFYTNFGTGNSSINNIGVSPNDVANAMGPAFAGVGAPSVSFKMSGVEGTPGHQALEWQWVKYDGASSFEGVPTAYSGSALIPGSTFTPQNTGTKEALTAQDATTYANERKAALGRLAFSPGCREFLASHGIDVRALMYAVKNQRPYDGRRSTITGADAGVVDPNDRNDVQYNSSRQMRDFFGSNTGTNAMTAVYPGGTLGNVGSGIYDRSDVYYRSSGINAATILHEALHTLLAETDPQIQRRLGLSTNEISGNITDKLRQEGCAE